MPQLTYTLEHDAGVAGGVANAQLTNTRSRIAAEAIPFGVFVRRETNGRVALPAAASDVNGVGALGVSVRSQQRAPAALDDVLQYEIGDIVNILDFGTVWVMPEDAVSEGAPAFVRFATGAGGTQLGAFRSDAVASESVELPGSTYEATAGAGELVPVRIRLT